MKKIRTERRAHEAEDWPLANAAVSRFTTDPVLVGRVRPVLVFSYSVNGETFYGSCVGYPVDETSGETVQSAIMPINALHVRYDPGDPGMSRVLNRDNSGFPSRSTTIPTERFGADHRRLVPNRGP
ncbi:MAG: hypothetical protein WCA10_03285 [Terracidiphilus sp.]